MRRHDAPRVRDRVTARRLLVRVVVCLACLAMVDVLAVRAAGPIPRIDSNWRAPVELPSAALPHAIRALERATDEDQPVVAFVGASPTWGDGLSDGSRTVPAAWARLARSTAASDQAASPPRVVNLAFNGQLMADTGTVARAAAHHADVVFVQVTYRTFSPSSREGATRRFPELPRLLGEPVGPAEAEVTRTQRIPTPDITGSVDRGLRRAWRLYDLRDTLAARWLRATPDERLHSAWENLTLPPFEETGEGTPGSSFDDLPPDEQTLLAQEWAADAEFTLDASDTELGALDVLAANLASRDATTVIYLAPVNVAALDSFGYLDRAGYERNVDAMRRVVERHRVRFVDLNREREWRSSDFIDISHTTVAGTALAARALWAETSSTIGGAP